MDESNVKNILRCKDKGESVVFYIGRIKSNRIIKKAKDRLDPTYHGYQKYKNCIMPYVKVDKDRLICITDDFGLHMINRLKKEGYNNFVLMLTDDDPQMIKKIVYYIKNNFNEKELRGIKILTLEEGKNMKFDLIISNPPYSLGNEITQNIINELNFDKFINLMPLSKYKKGKLFNHVEDMLRFDDSLVEGNCFDDAMTAPDICMISKKDQNYSDYDDFELRFYYDKRLSKFYLTNHSRKKCFSDHICICSPKKWEKINSKTSFACGIYTPHDKVHSINDLKSKFNNIQNVESFLNNPNKSLTRDCSEEYIWNFIKPDCKLNDCFVPVSSGPINQIITIFNSELEKDNFVNWWYSAERNGKNPKSGLASILLAGLNKPTDCPFSEAIPNVDWTHTWTDEEILRDYGYSKDEISYILSLGNYDLYRHALSDFS